MPKKGLGWCVHEDGSGCRAYWLIKGTSTRYLIECKDCGKQRWSTAKFRFRNLEYKPKEVNEKESE